MTAVGISQHDGSRWLPTNDLLGTGRFKRVYRSYDVQTGRPCAWYVHRPSIDEREITQMIREVNILAAVDHPNVLKLYSAWINEATGCPSFVTQIQNGGNVRSFVDSMPPLKLGLIKRWAREILSGLAHLHSKNPPIIHRDLKCDNIFIGAEGQCVIGDFGMSHQREMTTSMVGTPVFMAPEMFESEYTESVDIYAFGMCILEMITKEYPYAECNGSLLKTVTKKSKGVLPDALQRIQVEPARAFIELCLQPSERRPTATALLSLPFLSVDPDLDDLAVSCSAAVRTTLTTPAPVVASSASDDNKEIIRELARSQVDVLPVSDIASVLEDYDRAQMANSDFISSPASKRTNADVLGLSAAIVLNYANDAGVDMLFQIRQDRVIQDIRFEFDFLIDSAELVAADIAHILNVVALTEPIITVIRQTIAPKLPWWHQVKVSLDTDYVDSSPTQETIKLLIPISHEADISHSHYMNIISETPGQIAAQIFEHCPVSVSIQWTIARELESQISALVGPLRRRYLSDVLAAVFDKNDDRDVIIETLTLKLQSAISRWLEEDTVAVADFQAITVSTSDEAEAIDDKIDPDLDKRFVLVFYTLRAGVVRDGRPFPLPADCEPYRQDFIRFRPNYTSSFVNAAYHVDVPSPKIVATLGYGLVHNETRKHFYATMLHGAKGIPLQCSIHYDHSPRDNVLTDEAIIIHDTTIVSIIAASDRSDVCTTWRQPFASVNEATNFIRFEDHQPESFFDQVLRFFESPAPPPTAALQTSTTNVYGVVEPCQLCFEADEKTPKAPPTIVGARFVKVLEAVRSSYGRWVQMIDFEVVSPSPLQHIRGMSGTGLYVMRGDSARCIGLLKGVVLASGRVTHVQVMPIAAQLKELKSQDVQLFDKVQQCHCSRLRSENPIKLHIKAANQPLPAAPFIRQRRRRPNRAWIEIRRRKIEYILNHPEHRLHDIVKNWPRDRLIELFLNMNRDIDINI